MLSEQAIRRLVTALADPGAGNEVAGLLCVLSAIRASPAEINRNNDAASQIVEVAANFTVSALLHDGRTILLSSLTGLAAALPSAIGSGARLRFVVGLVNTSGAYTVTANGEDRIQGVILTCSTTETPDLAQSWSTAGDSDTIALNGTTTGGVQVGDWFELEDILPGQWAVRGMTTSSGAEATPFS